MSFKTLLLCAAFLVPAGALAADPAGPAAGAPLPLEPIPHVLALPAHYPATWMFAHDTNFFSLLDGKVVVVDVASATDHYKGMIGAGQFASFLAATSRPELYVAETYYSRRTRGVRSDVITIYDTATLKPQAEIALPGEKRGLVVTQKASFQFTDGERLALVFNFTPAASVTVVDLLERKVLNEVQIPGCSLIYPTGKRGFSTLCGNGTLATFSLNEQGEASAPTTSAVFNDIDNDPLFMKTATVDGISYFPSFKGRLQAIDFRGEKAKIGAVWSLVSKDEAAAGWRPSGWQVISADAKGRLYVLMQEGGHDGTHKDGGGEVWVFDAKSKKRLKRLVLDSPGVTIEATMTAEPLLVVVNAEMEFDVYNPETGAKIRTIGGRMTETPFVLHAIR